ncbi:hypothetical protein IWW36_000795 [Coemansia brasiliensis]|uniref:Uncharacterized protein n=1 Tax=Coemansia brasiliensis TaxID=2650707 RepID=A0A9W8IIZ9_9FUNG|nr:hypothetical protein IWW36_000795 [Coemansia brasiliensis]
MVDVADSTQGLAEDQPAAAASTENSPKPTQEHTGNSADNPQTDKEEAAAVIANPSEAEHTQPQVHVQPPSTNNSPSLATDTEASALPQGMQMRRTSTSSSSKFHDAIQDIISQFDPLKVSASTTQLPDASAAAKREAEEEQRQAELRARFEPETDGFSYNEFLAQLRNPAAKPVARTVKSFLTEFSRRPMTLAEQVRFVHDFLDFIAAKMRDCPVWQRANEREFENAREGMEKLVMNRLFPVCFSPSTSDDADKDHVLREKMSLFRWIREEHLDIPQDQQNAAFLQFAKAELLKMNNFKSPRDKAICILNCCTVIYALLRNAQTDGSEDIGADRFLPLLIFVVITANPPRLVSNIQYITRFRSPERMQGEAGYYVTNLQGAIAFIETMDASCLSISQEEFDKNIEMTIWEMDIEKRAHARDRQQAQHNMQAGGSDPSNSQASAEPAQWLLDRSSDLAKTTLEKTNTFVGRLISEFSTPPAGDSGQATPRPGSHLEQTQFPGNAARRAPTQRQPHEAEGAEAVDRADWNSTLALVHDMFPNIDADVVELVFESNRGIVSRTIEQLLDISTGNEAAQVAREHSVEEQRQQQASDNAVEEQRQQQASDNAKPPQPGSSVGGENDVDEMERWKGHWADDDDGSDYEADADNEPISAAISAEAAGTFVEPAEDKGHSTSTIDSISKPDTSKDAELARKLQREFEQTNS